MNAMTIIICAGFAAFAVTMCAVAFAEAGSKKQDTQQTNADKIMTEPTGEIIWPYVDTYIKKEVARQLKEQDEARK
jgi:hypothetical protein